MLGRRCCSLGVVPGTYEGSWAGRGFYHPTLGTCSHPPGSGEEGELGWQFLGCRAPRGPLLTVGSRRGKRLLILGRGPNFF